MRSDGAFPADCVMEATRVRTETLSLYARLPVVTVQEACKRLERRFRNVVLDPLRIRLGGLCRHPDGAQHVNHEPVPGTHPMRQLRAGFVKKTPRYGREVAMPARLSRAMVLMAVASDTPKRRAMSVGRASPALANRSSISSTSSSSSAVDCAERVLPKRRAWVVSAGSTPSGASWEGLRAFLDAAVATMVANVLHRSVSIFARRRQSDGHHPT